MIQHKENNFWFNKVSYQTAAGRSLCNSMWRWDFTRRRCSLVSCNLQDQCLHFCPCTTCPWDTGVSHPNCRPYNFALDFLSVHRFAVDGWECTHSHCSCFFSFSPQTCLAMAVLAAGRCGHPVPALGNSPQLWGTCPTQHWLDLPSSCQPSPPWHCLYSGN